MTSFQNIKTVNSEESPCSRWGHSMVSIQNHIYVFGGFENSKYYDDLWRFDLVSLSFQKVEQQGELPPPCSNFTLNYYEHQNTLLLFGGGTVNKEKLNAIYKLDMSTFIWSKIDLDQSSATPWQRSYHCAEIIGNYLVITGGEFFHDLDDTWTFNLDTNQWRQIKLNEEALKPKARKFASSFTHNNKLYIIGGCSGKYECLEECYEMDFTEFLETGNQKSLFWKIVQFANKEHLIRWGHISLIKGNKAYVFGGRHNSKDLQNLVEIDIVEKTCQTIQFKGQSPKGRRRPGICIKNNTLFCFSGFDGSYVKDFIYFNLPANLENVKLKQDTQGKRCLEKLLTPNNVEQQWINFNDDVLYVTEEEFEKVEKYFSENYSQQTVKLFKEINYHLSLKKITTKSRFFTYFFDRSYKSEQLQLYCSQKMSKQKKTAISKMLATYFQLGKIVVPRCEFVNTKQYLINLVEISEYYCLSDLHEICKKELLRFLHDQIVSPKFNFPNIMNMCDVMVNIDIKYQKYAGFLMLTKIVSKNRTNLSSLGELKQLVRSSKQFPNKEWLMTMIEQHSFELSQLIMLKKEVDFENINCANLPHKQEILYQKTRKGSMHSRQLNA